MVPLIRAPNPLAGAHAIRLVPTPQFWADERSAEGALTKIANGVETVYRRGQGNLEGKVSPRNGRRVKAMRLTTDQTLTCLSKDGSLLGGDMPPFLPLAEAAKLLPGRRPGKRISVGTLWRWCQRGFRHGVRLKSVLIGGQRCTTREWLQDFIKALS